MREAPENLDYGTATQNDKFAKANAMESYLEKGKYDTARAGHQGKECDDAALRRMLGVGSHDPMYADSHRNIRK